MRTEALIAGEVVVLRKGIVSKREGSFYRNGRSRNWLKTKNPTFVRT